jgi:Xaa-Pro aminopeptidase
LGRKGKKAMKKDLDKIMLENDLDVLVVTGPCQHNPAMVYLTGGGHITFSDLIKKRGEKPVLFHHPMERDEAAKTGLPTMNYSDAGMQALVERFEGNRQLAQIYRYGSMFKTLGIERGNVGFFGNSDVGKTFASIEALREDLPEIQIKTNLKTDVLLSAMSTKDEEEVARIRRMGEITIEVVDRVKALITSQTVKNEQLFKSNGEPLTIGEVKRKINLWLAELGAENPENTIFAMGRDAGVPHSGGNPDDILTLGKTIVFDIFPCEEGGGYFHDFTRTWCLGYATDEAYQLYEQVLSVFNQLISEFKIGTSFFEYQKRTCELFEAMGHPTVSSSPTTTDGYVHSLGHGVGVNIHELPMCGYFADNSTSILNPGSVIAVEPGLYYPEKGMGVRLENTFWAKPNGEFEMLVEYPLDLVLPVKS